ncbi:MAG: FAD-binding protein [Chloroflexi bacterium]|nr:FAD-binding protein [Chloroflexota bacterium]
MGVIAGAATDAFAIDGVAPRERVSPRDAAEVRDAIRAANAAREALVIWGGGTRIDIGDAPERYDVALDLRGLSGVVAHEPADLTVTVRAGTTLADLAKVLAPHRQWWPVEVAHPERATVGGTIAGAAGGPSRYRYLHPRDWTIGVQAVLGDGTLTRAGGRVVKNVTGYDLTKLYSGSYGTLCALTEVTLKLTPLPSTTLTLRADLPDLAHAYRVGRELLRERLPLDAIAVASGPAAQALAPTWAALFIRVAGNAASVARLREAAARTVGRLVEDDASVWGRIAALPADARTSARGTWPPARPVEPYAADVVWYPGLETAHLMDEQEGPELLAAVRGVAETQAGALVLERGPAELRRALGTWGTARIPKTIADGLRARFDPNGVLAPGRMP